MNNDLKLSSIENDTRLMINEFCEKNNMTLNKFCLEAKLHQTNVRLFLTGSSVNSKTLQRIGEFLEKKIENFT